MNRRPVRGVIFDLDDTLFDCTGLLTMPARERASAVLAAHTDLTATRLTSDQTELAATMGSTDTIRTIAARHDILQDIVDAHEQGRPTLGPIDVTHHITEACIAVAESHRAGGGWINLPLQDRDLYIFHI